MTQNLQPKDPAKPKEAPKKLSILDRAVDAKEIGVTEDYLIKAALLGPTGTGKTQSSITLPLKDDKPILLIDFDGRSETVAGEPHVVVLKLFDPDPASPKAWNEGEQVRTELWAQARSGDFPYSGVIEDSLSMMARIAMNFALTLDNKRGLGGAPAKQHWNPQIHALVRHINSMRMLPCHYVITGHFDLLQDEDDGKLKILPKITRSLRTEFPSWFNETYYTHREGGKEGKVLYYWTTAGTGKYEFFKSTLNNKQKYWKDPIAIDFDKPPVGFERLLGMRFGGVK